MIKVFHCNICKSIIKGNGDGLGFTSEKTEDHTSDFAYGQLENYEVHLCLKCIKAIGLLADLLTDDCII
jgi:hypothetical protein